MCSLHAHAQSDAAPGAIPVALASVDVDDYPSSFPLRRLLCFAGIVLGAYNCGAAHERALGWAEAGRLHCSWQRWMAGWGASSRARRTVDPLQGHPTRGVAWPRCRARRCSAARGLAIHLVRWCPLTRLLLCGGSGTLPHLAVSSTARACPAAVPPCTGYMGLYFTRGSLTYCAPVLLADPKLNMSITDLGAMTSAFPLAYGFSK